MSEYSITMLYRNWRGEVAQRTIRPFALRFGSTEWHPQPGWLLSAHDVEKGEPRDFALADCQFADLRPAPAVPDDSVEPVAWRHRYSAAGPWNYDDTEKLAMMIRDGVLAKPEHQPLYTRPAPAVPDDVAGLVSELRADAELHQDLLPDRAADAILALAAEVLQLRGILNDRVQDARAARSTHPTHEQVLAHLQRCIDQGKNARPKKKQSKGTRG